VLPSIRNPPWQSDDIKKIALLLYITGILLATRIEVGKELSRRPAVEERQRAIRTGPAILEVETNKRAKVLSPV